MEQLPLCVLDRPLFGNCRVIAPPGFSGSLDFGSSLIGNVTQIVAIPVLLVLTIVLLSRARRNEPDPRMRALIVVALAVKLGSSLVRLFVISSVYGNGDAMGFDGGGRFVSAQFRHLDFDPDLEGNLIGTNWMHLFTGVVYTFVGPRLLPGFLIYSWLAFWGLYLWYVAFRQAVPEGNRRLYGYLVFFLPSLLFWPSSIGKEAWMTLALGIAAYGLTRALTGATARGIGVMVVGIWCVAMVRPHVALMFLIAAVAAYVLRPAAHGGRRGTMRKVLGLAALIALSISFVGRTESFFNVESLDAESVTEVSTKVEGQTGKASSEFEAPNVLSSPGRLPLGIITVLFRPFPTEARNSQALFSAMEALGLAVLLLLTMGRVLAGVASARRQPFVAFAATYVLAFCVVFSTLSNFGILARQRVQVLPAFLVLIAARPRTRQQERSELTAGRGPTEMAWSDVR